MRMIKQRNFFYRSFTTALIVACLPTLLIGILSHTIGTRQIEQEVNRTSMAQAASTFQRVDEELGKLETTFAQWAFNPSFDESLRTMDLRDSFDRTNDLLRTLFLMKSSNTLVKDVFLYLRDQDALMSDTAGVTRIVVSEEKAEYDALLREQDTIFWTTSLQKHAIGKGSSPLSLVIRIPGGGVDSFGAIIIAFDPNRIASFISERSVSEDGTALLLREDGGIVASSSAVTAGSLSMAIAQYASVQSLSREAGGGAGMLEWNDASYMVTYKAMNRANEKWIFVTAASFEAMVKPVEWTSRFIIISGLFGMLVAVLLSWFASRRLSEPLHQLLVKLGVADSGAMSDDRRDEFTLIAEQWSSVTRESKQLQSKLDRHIPSLREGFLLQLVQGRFGWLREDEIRSRAEQIGWETEDSQYGVLLGKLYGLGSPESRFAEGDEQLLTFAAVNIAGELATAKWPQTQVINFQDLTLGLLFEAEASRSPESVRADMFRFGKELAEALSDMLKIHATFIVARPTEGLSELSDAVEDARQALRYREWLPGHEVIGVEDVLPSLGERRLREYPFEEEKAALQALRLGRLEETKTALSEFYAKLTMLGGSTGPHVSRSAAQLLGGMMHVVLQDGSDPYELMQHEDAAALTPYEQLLAIHSSAESQNWLLNKLVSPYVSKLESEQNLKMKRLIEQAVQLLKHEYTRDLSLEECAERLGTYPQKLSIGFKQITGYNYIDYLTKLRLDKSKELLTETTMKVNDIAIAVGYQPSYFNRIFKKHEGMTPGQYREQQQLS